ncbi:TIGR00282 family metallophosphoesterase [Mycoplasmatota bacterium]|nr:TIGR00282 family metallophosphoesterase [Mycoplasmatota bacterium]
MKILFLGDVVGSLGRKALDDYLPEIRKEHNINLVIANGENASHGRGITKKIYKWFLENGVSAVTMGNHTWHNPDIFNFIDEASKLVVPLNYPNGTPGKGVITFKYNNISISVVSLIGMIYMQGTVKCPFQTMDDILEEIDSDIIIVDFHAEATSEKIALGHYLDGRITALIGTHTHVPTIDARILPNGTAYQSDAGMNGALDGIIGVEREGIIRRFKTGLPTRFQPIESGRVQFNGTIVDIDDSQHNATNIYTVNIVR